ncbi:MAG: hypothetical protein IJN54_01530 [Lachnospiraceae bacterium]|nr:hypothetical protein [Lachnospiraceae bacterium]
MRNRELFVKIQVAGKVWLYQMKIAYLITAYKDEKQLARLVEALMCDGTDFYIHIDKKVDELPFKQEIGQLKQNGSNAVHFVDKADRVRVHWGGYSQVKAQMVLIKKMLQANGNYDWCINLTGTDYPIMSNEKIKEFLRKQNESPVIKGYQIDCLYGTEREEGAKDRVRKYWFYDIEPIFFRRVISKIAAIGQKALKINRKPGMEQMPWKFCYGSEYWALPFKVVKKVYHEYIQDKELQKVLKTVFIPSEFWVHTVLMSTNILSEREKEDIRFPGNLYDGLGSVALLHYFVYRDGIKVLDMEDYETIKKSERMFIRKVQTGVSDELIQRIQKERK